MYRRERDRYWILDAHPSLNLLAAGHDSGLSIFKLARERPPYSSSKRELYYYKDLYIRKFEFKSGKDTPLLATRRRGTNSADVNKCLDYNTSNKSSHCILLTSVGPCLFPSSQPSRATTRRPSGPLPVLRSQRWIMACRMWTDPLFTSSTCCRRAEASSTSRTAAWAGPCCKPACLHSDQSASRGLHAVQRSCVDLQDPLCRAGQEPSGP